VCGEKCRLNEDLVVNKDSFSFFRYADIKQIPRQMIAKGDDGKYHATGHPNWGVHQPSQWNFTGRLYVLINGGCFSGCAEFASIAHHHRRAVFIGEESGGGYYGNTSGLSPAVTLPNTKLMVFVPLLSYYMAVRGYKAAARGVIPKYSVTYTITELMAGVDKEMSLALKLGRDE
jgi:C-terminal processing protease CtpA/Prc